MTTDPQPQYAPGDPVLVAGVVIEQWSKRVSVRATDPMRAGAIVVDASDVHPVPPTPDHRDTAIAAVRALCDQWDNDGEWGPGDPVERIRRALDGVVPVPAPPAPTPTGWTAAEDSVYQAAREVVDLDPTYDNDAIRDALDMLKMTLSVADAPDAGEAAAAAPATTDDDRVERAARIIYDRGQYPERWEHMNADRRKQWMDCARRVLAAVDAHRAAGSPS